MEAGKTSLERAFELAHSGTVESLSDLLRRLKVEGYGTDHITGRSLRSQLRALIQVAQQRRLN